MTRSAPVETIEQLVDALAAQDLDAVLSLYHTDAAWEIHVPRWDALVTGKPAIEERLIPWFIARDRYEITGYQIIDHGDTVALRWEQHWRDSHDGAPCTCHQSHFFEVSDGLVHRQWMYWAGVTAVELDLDVLDETEAVT